MEASFIIVKEFQVSDSGGFEGEVVTEHHCLTLLDITT